MIINTENTFGYNNKLKRANSNMKLGVNLDVNIEQKSVGIKHNLRTSKVQLLHTDNPKSSQSVGKSTLGSSQIIPSSKSGASQSLNPLQPSQSEKPLQSSWSEKPLDSSQKIVRDEHGFNSNHELNSCGTLSPLFANNAGAEGYKDLINFQFKFQWHSSHL